MVCWIFWAIYSGFDIDIRHNLQVIAVLIGGIYILRGHITAEKLTKFILYSEWLIYSTWWVGDNLSSLMQSIGASEKVFNLIDLPPSDQFSAEGMCFSIFYSDILPPDDDNVM